MKQEESLYPELYEIVPLPEGKYLEAKIRYVRRCKNCLAFVRADRTALFIFHAESEDACAKAFKKTRL